MEKELSLIKTSVGLVSEETFDGLKYRAVEILKESETKISLIEAVNILLNLASQIKDVWFDSGCGFEYIEFDTSYDYYSVFNWSIGTEIIIVFNDNIVVFNLKNKKYYREFRKNDEVIKEEIAL